MRESARKRVFFANRSGIAADYRSFLASSDITDSLDRGLDSLHGMDYFDKRRQLGQRIVETRKAQNISQKQLALMSNINQGYLSEVENGISNISINKLFRIADALGISPSYLFTEPEIEVGDPFTQRA
ncbi:helix-turn-helix domain-containing protein [Gordonibacter faecis]